MASDDIGVGDTSPTFYKKNDIWLLIDCQVNLLYSLKKELTKTETFVHRHFSLTIYISLIYKKDITKTLKLEENMQTKDCNSCKLRGK